MTADDSFGRLDDDDYPAYTMGRAVRIAARARELVDHGTPIEAACRIVILEDQLEEARRINAEYRRAAESAGPTAAA
ncbi:hypothetical protein [Streptomyces xanthophaeus]|uniref:hypothetical protein n=1 Tax=Streptomyces xanthophaeus TaxID=67385 RepID=UPI0004CD5488|nr:hypothetical protein [Streptomyces xanthophaeus]